MTAVALDRRDVPAAPSPEPGRSAPAPLYIVCSPNRQVGKTMLARLLAEHYMADGRPVAAFDLSDETPGLADFLPPHVTIPSIQDMRGQVRIFHGIIKTAYIPKIIVFTQWRFT